MVIGERLKQVRESKKMSQGDIEKRTGLFRCYTSRVECGHTIPSIETLEKFAHALEIPLYQLFYDGDEKPKALRGLKQKNGDKLSRKDAQMLSHFGTLLGKMKDRNRQLLLHMARKLARPSFIAAKL
jgi:transcriptional regulator with XRE-family HTH domain